MSVAFKKFQILKQELNSLSSTIVLSESEISFLNKKEWSSILLDNQLPVQSFVLCSFYGTQHWKKRINLFDLFLRFSSVPLSIFSPDEIFHLYKTQASSFWLEPLRTNIDNSNIIINFYCLAQVQDLIGILKEENVIEYLIQDWLLLDLLNWERILHNPNCTINLSAMIGHFLEKIDFFLTYQEPLKPITGGTYRQTLKNNMEQAYLFLKNLNTNFIKNNLLTLQDNKKTVL